MDLAYATPVAGLSAIVFAVYLAHCMLKKPNDTTNIAEISNLIKICATTCLNRQFKTVLIFGVALATFLLLTMDIYAVLTFLIGAFFSATSAYIGVFIAIRANARTASSAKMALKRH